MGRDDQMAVRLADGQKVFARAQTSKLNEELAQVSRLKLRLTGVNAVSAHMCVRPLGACEFSLLRCHAGSKAPRSDVFVHRGSKLVHSPPSLSPICAQN